MQLIMNDCYAAFAVGVCQSGLDTLTFGTKLSVRICSCNGANG